MEDEEKLKKLHDIWLEGLHEAIKTLTTYSNMDGKNEDYVACMFVICQHRQNAVKQDPVGPAVLENAITKVESVMLPIWSETVFRQLELFGDPAYWNTLTYNEKRNIYKNRYYSFEMFFRPIIQVSERYFLSTEDD